MMTGAGQFEGSAGGRRESRKRRRVSERRRVFSRINLAAEQRQFGGTPPVAGSLSSGERSWSRQSTAEHPELQFPIVSRSGSPMGDNGKISMKIQFHITPAPDNEPLILDASQLELANLGQQSSSASSMSMLSSSMSTDNTAVGRRRQQSSESIGDQIHERLSRQSSSSQRRRQHLLALHNQAALDTGASPATGAQVGDNSGQLSNSLPEQLGASPQVSEQSSGATFGQLEERETGARSSTITGASADEATIRFLARHRQTALARPSQSSLLLLPMAPSGAREREHIYFKRDGQRFGHEHTLKLSIDRTYRCLLKVRPLIPLQAISIQGHQVLFVDCSQSASGSFPIPASASPVSGGGGSGSQSAPSSALASSAHLNRSWNNIHHRNSSGQQQARASISATINSTNHHRLNHAQTQVNFNKSNSQFLYQQQQSQMMRHFAASHCSSSSSAHLGSQLIYMFDWSASRFEVNKNKARTQIQTVLKFKNGQILSLPLQVKFYQPDSKQHLSWGSQLHFIDFDCNINNMGQINVDRINYY